MVPAPGTEETMRRTDEEAKCAEHLDHLSVFQEGNEEEEVAGEEERKNRMER